MPRSAIGYHNGDASQDIRVGKIVAFRDVKSNEPIVRERINVRGGETTNTALGRLWNTFTMKRAVLTDSYIQVQVLESEDKSVGNFVRIANDLERFREDLERHSIEEAKANRLLDDKFNNLNIRINK